MGRLETEACLADRLHGLCFIFVLGGSNEIMNFLRGWLGKVDLTASLTLT
jgi:hypothetical protein